ncbi:MAG: hypothetical protein WB902_01580 [Acetobacteraceae bacterium]
MAHNDDTVRAGQIVVRHTIDQNDSLKAEMRRRIAGGAYSANAAHEAGVFGIDQVDRCIGPVGQHVEFDLRIDKADVECAEAVAADIDLLFQDKLFVLTHLVAIIAPARIVSPGAPSKRRSVSPAVQQMSEGVHVRAWPIPPIVFVLSGAGRLGGRCRGKSGAILI